MSETTIPETTEEYNRLVKELTGPGHQETLRQRASEEPKTFRSSLLSAMIGLDKSRSRHKAFMRVAFGLKEPVGERVQTLYRFGTATEHHGVAYAEKVSGRLFFHTGDRQKFLQKGRFTCHPDGIDHESILEVKSRAPELEAYEAGDHNWVKHMCQVQQNMWLADRDKAVFACFCVNSESRCWEVYRSEPYLRKMHELLETFIEFVDGMEKCPKRLGRRPTMPEVKYRLIDGAEAEQISYDLVRSIASEKAKTCSTLDQLSELEDELAREYHGWHTAILDGTAEHYEFLRDPERGF